MKPEMLDPLLLDRALGELSPEVAALLDEHLAQNPAAARRASEFSSSIPLARAAVATPPATPRPLDVARLQSASAARGNIRPMELLRLAACLALGLTLGWLARPTPPAPAPIAVAALTPVTARPTDPPTQFWSVARFAPEARRPQGLEKP